MSYLAVDFDGSEYVYIQEPHRTSELTWEDEHYFGVELPKGSIEKLINKKLNWDNEPVKI